MKSKSTAGMTAKQKTVVGVLLAIVVALLWGGGIASLLGG